MEWDSSSANGETEGAPHHRRRLKKKRCPIRRSLGSVRSTCCLRRPGAENAPEVEPEIPSGGGRAQGEARPSDPSRGPHPQRMPVPHPGLSHPSTLLFAFLFSDSTFSPYVFLLYYGFLFIPCTTGMIQGLSFPISHLHQPHSPQGWSLVRKSGQFPGKCIQSLFCPPGPRPPIMDSDLTSILALRKLSSLPRRTHFHKEASVSKVNFIKDTGGVTKSERGASCPCGQNRNSPQWLVVSQILPFLTLFWYPSPPSPII